MKKLGDVIKPSPPAEATRRAPLGEASGTANRIARGLSLLSRSQDQVEQRLAVSVQSVKAAEAMVSESISELDALRAEQDELRQQMREEVVQSLRSYDQWVGRVERDVTEVVHLLDERLASLESKWEKMQGQLQAMVHRAEALLDQSVVLLGRGPVKNEQPPMTSAVTVTKREPATPVSVPTKVVVAPMRLEPAKPAVRAAKPVKMDMQSAPQSPPAASPADRVFSKLLQQMGRPGVDTSPKTEDAKQQPTPEADAA
ncbi:MAG: hypothetical protein IT441_05400 [Phycisphaeraceae bacterium]|nr:hypothetical protein [Phycisphaeraceae bacterium]